LILRRCVRTGRRCCLGCRFWSPWAGWGSACLCEVSTVFLAAVFARLPLGCTMRVTGLEAMSECCCVLLRLVREGMVQDWLEAVLSANDSKLWRERPLAWWGLGRTRKSETLRGNDSQEHVSNICSSHTQEHTGEATWKRRLVNHQWESIVHSLLN
jgi:hypothetical protein